MSAVSRCSPPDNDSLQPSGLNLQSHEVAHTTFIESSAIVDHENVAWCGAFERLQEDIDAPHMSSRTRATGQATTRH